MPEASSSVSIRSVRNILAPQCSDHDREVKPGSVRSAPRAGLICALGARFWAKWSFQMPYFASLTQPLTMVPHMMAYRVRSK